MGDAPYFFDRAELEARARGARDAYRRAEPFPHAVLDDLLPLEVAAACADAFPGREAIPWDLYTDGGRTLKLTCDDEAVMPPFVRQVVGQFGSGAMIGFLEELTGITGLVADPHLGGGGLHRIEPGGFLDVHADFNKHMMLGLDRRLNVLYYLNPGWDDSWEGHLELWDRDMQRCVRRVAPVLNRCVVFSTTSHSYHGHPRPLACPPGQARKSLAFYYYTNGRPAEEAMPPHSTLYQVPGRAPAPVIAAAAESGGLRAAVGRRLPPGVKAAVMTAARRVAGLPASGQPGSAVASVGRSTADDHWSRINRIYAELSAQGRGGRPCYTWSLLHAGDVARTLGYQRITAIEFGVAGGNGLLALETAAAAVVEHLGVTVDAVGFDHGTGLPPAQDYRDAPYLMEAGQFPMDEARLRAQLRNASLHLGLVRDTVGPFIESGPAPIGFVSFDLDYYSSTMDAFRLFDAGPEHFLPRVLCYFDDILGYPWGESNGERLAIRHFNEAHDHRVVDFLPGLRYSTPAEEFHSRWVESMYVAHVLDHPRKNEDEGVAIVTRLDLP